jgi:hypothetical protein
MTDNGFKDPWLRLSILYRQGDSIEKEDIINAFDSPGPIPEYVKPLLKAVISGVCKFKPGLKGEGSSDPVLKKAQAIIYSDLVELVAEAISAKDYSNLPEKLRNEVKISLAGRKLRKSSGKMAAKQFWASKLAMSLRKFEGILKLAQN